MALFRLVSCSVVTAGLLLAPAQSPAQSRAHGPQVPCAGAAIHPTYPEPGQKLDTRVWRADELRGWTPPPCMNWETKPYDFILASAGRFKDKGPIARIIQRVVGFSKLPEIQYWSASKEEWRQLFVTGGTLQSADLEDGRDDVSTDKIRTGSELLYFQDENTILGPVIFKMTIQEWTLDRFVFTSTNVTPFSAMFVDAVKPGGFDQYYLIERDGKETWRYYSVARSSISFNLLAPSKASSVNRAAAYFRHVAGLPYKSQTPPARE